MSVVRLLILWTVPLLPAGGTDHASISSFVPFTGATALPSRPGVIQRLGEDTASGGPTRFGLGIPCWDEEDTLDDLLTDGALLAGPLPWASRDEAGPGLAHPHRGPLRDPSHLHPLRC
jgi:hypothetical protein